jgi:hypothetical protein
VIALAIGLGLSAPSSAHADSCAVATRLRAIQEAAARHLGLDERPRWRGRSRWAALLPQVTVRADAGLGWAEGGETPVTSIEVDHDRGAGVRMTWRLDRLLYNPDEPRLLDAERRARRARVVSDQEVTRLYFRWRRAAAGTTAGHRRAAPTRVLDDDAARDRDETWAREGDDARVRDRDDAAALEEAEAFAQLDALTGGWLDHQREGCR